MSFFQAALRTSQELRQRQATVLAALHPAEPARARWATPCQERIRLGDSLALRRWGALDQGPAALVVTPQVNHSCVADFSPEQSLVRTLLQAGLPQVAVTEWAAPPDRPYGIADSIDDIQACVEQLGGRAHLVGLCQGGWQAAILAALQPELATSLTLAAAPIDTHAGETLLHGLVFGLPMSFFQGVVRFGGGNAPGRLLSSGFDLLKLYERQVYHPWSLYFGACDPETVRRFGELRNWYQLDKDIAGQLYLEVVRLLFKDNALHLGQLELRGQRADLSRIRCPVNLVAGLRDHITPPEQVWALERHLAPQQAERYLADAGHIGVFMGRGALSEIWPPLGRSLVQGAG